MKIRKIITHPGNAHRDDFYACAIALAVAEPSAVIVRTDLIEEDDFEDPEVWVLDVGMTHDPSRGLFDHHQLPADAPPICAMSLVLQHLGVYEQAKAALPWVELMEILDSKGPRALTKHLEVLQFQDTPTALPPVQRLLRTWDTVVQPMMSPMEEMVISDFQALGEIIPSYALHTMMRALGEQIIDNIREFDEALREITAGGRVVLVKGLKVMVPPPGLPSTRLMQRISAVWRASVAPDAAVSIFPDDRSGGFSLYRFDDHPRVDFNRLKGKPGIKFAAPSGFIAKTEARDVDAALRMVAAATSDE